MGYPGIVGTILWKSVNSNCIHPDGTSNNLHFSLLSAPSNVPRGPLLPICVVAVGLTRLAPIGCTWRSNNPVAAGHRQSQQGKRSAVQMLTRTAASSKRSHSAAAAAFRWGNCLDRTVGRRCRRRRGRQGGGGRCCCCVCGNARCWGLCRRQWGLSRRRWCRHLYRRPHRRRRWGWSRRQ